MGAAFKPFERQLHDATEARARTLCGAEVFEQSLREGAAMSLDEALASALAEPAASAV
jgi:hypothetical protein